MKRYFHLYLQLINWKDRIKSERNNKSGLDSLSLRNGLNFETQGSVKITNDIFLEIFKNKAYLKFISSTPKTIIDIGGHFGFFSIQMAKKFPSSRILTFEPGPQTFKILENNVKQNNIKKIEIYNLAVGAEECLMAFYENENHESSSLYNGEGDSKKIQVSVTTLKTIITKNSIKTIDVLKLDCEGAEFEIINGNLDILSNYVHKIICEYHTSLRKDKELVSDLILPLKSANFEVKTIKINESLGFIYAQNKNFNS